jgi:hypothetical protein
MEQTISLFACHSHDKAEAKFLSNYDILSINALLFLWQADH